VEAPLIIILFWYFASKYLARAFRRLSSDFAAVVVVALLPLPLWFRVADLISGFRLVTDIFFFSEFRFYLTNSLSRALRFFLCVFPLK